jgi:hypothetical protein
MGAVLPGLFLLKRPPPLLPEARLFGSFGMLRLMDGIPPPTKGGYLIGGGPTEVVVGGVRRCRRGELCAGGTSNARGY